MTLYLKAEDWKPVGVQSLEDSAEMVVRSFKNHSVIAGPGSGKTELLAQRACFLLQTGACGKAKRILAISFKKDAAFNLKDRVLSRCGNDLANRFDSYTFDAFAKSICDRFMNILPGQWRPSEHYAIENYRESAYSDHLNSFTQNQINSRNFEDEIFRKNPLPINGYNGKTPVSLIAKGWWEKCLNGDGTNSRISFPMISRLAELIIRLSSEIKLALKTTYSFVFLDEFQDTTKIQYDLFHTIFADSKSILTAVGDNKQRIMVWAGALENSFDIFEKDFNAERISLLCNYRSSPELVRIQQFIAHAIDAKAPKIKSMVTNKISGDSCIIYKYNLVQREADHIAATIQEEMMEGRYSSRDFAILVRQKASDYAPLLQNALEQKNIKFRDESKIVGKFAIQDVLADSLTEYILSYLKLGSTRRSPKLWDKALKIIAGLSESDPSDESEGRRIQKRLSDFHNRLYKEMIDVPKSQQQCAKVLNSVLTFFNPDFIKALHIEYKQGTYYADMTESISELLWQSTVNSKSWDDILVKFEGADCVPLMTVHKSKGLEFHCMIFVGLDDQAWWSHSRNIQESRSTFFVAFTRAKQKIIFTYCSARGGRQKISDLYHLLETAGVQILEIT